MQTCFIIMPFGGQLGTERQTHYRLIYEDVLKPTIEKLGFEVGRADDNKHTALVTKEIIFPLAQADLVIADLSDTRPNVLYELGIRHALRKHGTIVIIDKATTPNLPFDIQQYRAIEYSSVSLRDINTLKQSLVEAINHEMSSTLSSAGNPVHEYITSLPSNVVESSLGSEQGRLQAQITELQRELKVYQARHGSLEDVALPADPFQIIEDAMAEARTGSTPLALISKAEAAARRNEVEEFLKSVKAFLSLKSSKPSDTQMLSMISLASQLNLELVVDALLDHAQRIFPSNRQMRLAQLHRFAHSADAGKRERARKEMAKYLGMNVGDQDIKFTRPLDDLDLGIVGVMLDTYHSDELHSEALAIVRALMAEHPSKSKVVRNYARTLAAVGDPQASLRQMRVAAFLPDADDTSAIWLGNELHNRELHVDAAEVYLLACLRDPNDGSGFVHFADEIATASLEEQSFSSAKSSLRRSLPYQLESARTIVLTALLCGLSCPSTSSDTQERTMRVAARMEIELDRLDEQELGELNAPGSRLERVSFARRMLEALKSDMTDPTKDIYSS